MISKITEMNTKIKHRYFLHLSDPANPPNGLLDTDSWRSTSYRNISGLTAFMAENLNSRILLPFPLCHSLKAIHTFSIICLFPQDFLIDLWIEFEPSLASVLSSAWPEVISTCSEHGISSGAFQHLAKLYTDHQIFAWWCKMVTYQP